MSIQAAANIGEAIRIASEGLKSGKWDLFRGQTNAQWQVTSSAERLSEEKRAEAYEVFERFVGWARTVEGMKKYLDQPDSLWAIAQHYSLPTYFIDFSDDPAVAAFFACDMKNAPADGQKAAMMCLNSQDFLRFWKQVGPTVLKGVKESSYPQLLRIDVDNLWRLQQQKGSFLWNPIPGIERFYDFDRIVFPYTASDPALASSEEIYPDQQSELERQLTEFFMNEQLLKGTLVMDHLKIFHPLDISAGSYDAASWHRAGIMQSPDWQHTEAWDQHVVEHSESVLPGASIELDSRQPLEQISKALCGALSPAFIEANRKQALQIRPAGGAKFDSTCAHLFVSIRRLWNGMRNLPYTSSEMSSAACRTVELFAVARNGVSDHEALGADTLYVEMGSDPNGRGAYSRGAVTPEAMVEACNPAFLDAARAELARLGFTLGPADDALAFGSLQLAARPWERFTFSGLRKLMVEELIPTQVAWRVDTTTDDNLRTVIYFSPKEFKVFGLA